MPQHDSGQRESGNRSRSNPSIFLLCAVATLLAVGYFGFRQWSAGRRQADDEAAEARQRIAALADSSAQPGSKTANPSSQPGDLPAQRAAEVPTLDLTAILGDALEQSPRDAAALIAESKQVVESLVKAFPQIPDAYEVAARLHFRLGDTERAVELWEQCLGLDAHYVHALRGLGMAAAKRGDEAAAITSYRRALEIQPDFHDAESELAQVLIDGNRVDEAIELLTKNVASDPRAYRGHVLLGMAYAQKEDYRRAKKSYEAAIADFPKHANAHFGLATACARLGETELSQQYMARFQELRAEETSMISQQRSEFDDLISLSDDTASDYAAAAKVCIACGAVPDAVHLWRRAAALDPQQLESRQALAWNAVQQGDTAGAITILEELWKLDPPNLRYPLEIARIHASTNNVDQGEKVLRDALKAAPDSGPAHVALANYLVEQRIKLDDARDLAQRAVNLDPAATNFALLSVTCERTGRLPEALQAITEAILRSPDNPQYRKFHDDLKKVLEKKK